MLVKGKQILDGVIRANKVVDETIIFKVDFRKVYDSVDLNYLKGVITKMNFQDREDGE